MLKVIKSMKIFILEMFRPYSSLPQFHAMFQIFLALLLLLDIVGAPRLLVVCNVHYGYVYLEVFCPNSLPLT